MILLIGFNLFINSWIPFDYDLIDKRNSTSKYIKDYNSKNYIGKFDVLVKFVTEEL